MNLVIFTPIQLFGDALTASLREFDEIEVLSTCRSADLVTNTVLELEPDVVLYDVTGKQALVTARCITDACPDIRMIAIAVPEIPEQVIACADAGFAGYIPRRASIEELRELIHMTLRGEATCHPRVAASLMRELHRRRGGDDPQQCEPLTKREAEVIKLVGRGLSNKEIARTLNLSVSTVKSHMHSLFAKLHVHGRGQATARLREEPWLAALA